MPDFGLDSDEIRELASPGCPPAFIALAIDCVTVDVEKRPNIRQVLERLMAIEREVVEAQAAVEKTYNVGSLTFTAKNTGRRRGGKDKRPPGPGRIPSFQGQIEGPKYSDSEKEEDFTGETSDEDVDDTLAKLSKLQIGNGRNNGGGGGSAFYLNADNAKGTSHLGTESEVSDTALARPNTYSVIKGSKTANRSSILFREPDFVDAPTINSSVITVKAWKGEPEEFGTPGSLPSLPSSWIRMAKKENANEEAEEDTTITLQSEAGKADDPFTEIEQKVQSHFSDETVAPISPSAAEATSTETVPEGEVEIAVADKFATIKSMSVPVPAPSDLTTSPIHSPDKKAFSPHRFTLVKPGWRALWEGSGGANDKNKTRYKPAGQKKDVPDSAPVARKRVDSAQGLAAVLPMQLLGAGLLTRCHVCEKRLGLMKPYLACDDCQHV